MKNLIVDYRISKEEEISLEEMGFTVLKCPPCEKLDKSTCGHPDMLLHLLDKNTILVHKDMHKSFIETLINLNKKIILSSNTLEKNYPFDIILNALSLSNHFVHYTNYTDDKLIKFINTNTNKKIINVKQGYTKCSVAIITNNAIMTSDIRISQSLKEENIDVLLLPPGDILLPGLDYGFIGGTCGLIDENLMAFYGDLNCYAYGKEVLEFVKKHGVQPIFLRNGKLIDRGSIFRI